MGSLSLRNSIIREDVNGLNFKMVRHVAFHRLQKNKNFGKACILSLAAIATSLLSIIMAQAGEITLGEELSLLVLLLSSLFLFSPFSLNLKCWYFSLSTHDPAFFEAMSFFSNIKIYAVAVWYCFIKSVLLFSYWTLAFIPTIIMAVAIRCYTLLLVPPYGIMIVVFAFLLIVFAILGVIYGIYGSLGFFYADYFYANGMTHNPFKAISLSAKAVKFKRLKLLSIYLYLLPYYFLCLFIIPIVFVMPYIKSVLAFYAGEKIDNMISVSSC